MFFVLLIPVIVSIFMYHKFDGITWKEMLLQVIGICIVIGAGYTLTRYLSMMDTEYLNGHITEKKKGNESCCHCRTVCDSRDKKGNCTSSHQVCDHFQDHWSGLETSVGYIQTSSCSVSSKPPVTWQNAYVGEPVSMPHTYLNYLFADKDSIIRKEVESKYKKIPSYPGMEGLYTRNHVVSVGVPIPKDYQDFFRKANDYLGNKKQVDLVIVLTNEQDPTYAQAIESNWLYGPKNSLTVVMGIHKEKIIWARAVTISKVSDLKISLRDKLQGKTLDEAKEIIVSLVDKKFKRTPMSTFEYLSKQSTPPTWALILLYILSIGLSIGIGLYMHEEDIL